MKLFISASIAAILWLCPTCRGDFITHEASRGHLNFSVLGERDSWGRVHNYSVNICAEELTGTASVSAAGVLTMQGVAFRTYGIPSRSWEMGDWKYNLRINGVRATQTSPITVDLKNPTTWENPFEMETRQNFYGSDTKITGYLYGVHKHEPGEFLKYFRFGLMDGPYGLPTHVATIDPDGNILDFEAGLGASLEDLSSSAPNIRIGFGVGFNSPTTATCIPEPSQWLLFSLLGCACFGYFAKQRLTARCRNEHDAKRQQLGFVKSAGGQE